jgi:serine protease Do
MFLLIKPEERTQIIEKTSLNKAINKVYDATVLVETYNNDTLKNTGTGFFYKKDDKYAYIITNEHVIANKDYVEIVNSEDKRVRVDILGKDEYLDLAVLRVDKKYAKKLVTISNSEKTKLGDIVFTVGSPLGYNYRGSITQGILSGRNRKVKVQTTDQDDWYMKVIQVDASINPGNSGGPLANINGEVIGIVSLKLIDDDIEGMGFAIPIEYAMNYIKYLEKNEEIKYPSLGIKIVDSNETSELLKNDIDINQDDVVIVLENKLGLNKGDLIIKINKQEIKGMTDLKYELYQYTQNDTVEITYIRNGKETRALIKLS